MNPGIRHTEAATFRQVKEDTDLNTKIAAPVCLIPMNDFQDLLDRALRRGTFTPARLAFERPIATACFLERIGCFPSFAWCISSLTNSPACVVGAFPSRLAFLARFTVVFEGIFSLRKVPEGAKRESSSTAPGILFLSTGQPSDRPQVFRARSVPQGPPRLFQRSPGPRWEPYSSGNQTFFRKSCSKPRNRSTKHRKVAPKVPA